MITINKLKVTYGDKTILKDLTLHIEKGSIHGLVGLNGSGKTTLLNTLYGLKAKSEGSITVLGREGNRKDFGYLETHNYFYPRITGLEFLKLVSSQNKKFSIDLWNRLFELPLSQLIDEYSTGMKKKLAMFGILSLNRPCLILDEPFNGIDLESVYILKNLLLKLKSEGKTILVTSHILESLTGICSSISYLNQGSIEFTLSNDWFGELEEKIFSIHQKKIDGKLMDIFHNE